MKIDFNDSMIVIWGLLSIAHITAIMIVYKTAPLNNLLFYLFMGWFTVSAFYNYLHK